MKYRTLSKSAFAVTVMIALAAAACANSAEVPPEETIAPTEPPPPETKIPASTTPTNTTPPEKKCAPSCKVDSDCTNSCPALQGGVQCCDTKTNTCWGSKTSACPVPEAAPVDPPPAY